MSDSPARVKLDVEIPTCAGKGFEVAQARQGGGFIPFYSPVKPSQGGQEWPVKPVSGTALGTICAEITYDSAPLPSLVKALVYPVDYLPLTLPATPPGAAVAGYSPDQGQTWKWGDNNRVPGADHYGTSPFPANILAAWKFTNGTWAADNTLVTFFGKTDPNSSCAPASGSGSMPGMSPMAAGTLYPAVWVAAVGAAAGALAALGARWALHQVPGAERATWENGGDGRDVASVRLSLCAKNGWSLSVAFRELRATYSLPYANNPFGPLKFPAREEALPGVGRVMLPEVVVAAL